MSVRLVSIRYVTPTIFPLMSKLLFSILSLQIDSFTLLYDKWIGLIGLD